MPSRGILDLVPSYRSLLVIYDPLCVTLDEIKAGIEDIWQNSDPIPICRSREP